MDSKGPLSPGSGGNRFIYVIVDQSSNSLVAVPTRKTNPHYAAKSLFHHWISKFGPLQKLITNWGTEYPISERANWCTLFHDRHSPEVSHALWTEGLVEKQIEYLGTHLSMFLNDTPENWSNQVHFFAFAHNTQPISHLCRFSYDIGFHTQPRIPVIFQIIFFRNLFCEGTAYNGSQLPPQSHYQSTDLNPLFHSIKLKPICIWFLAIETAVLQTGSKVSQYLLKKKTFA